MILGWRGKDGTEYWTHVVIDPVRGADGSVVGLFALEPSLNRGRFQRTLGQP